MVEVSVEHGQICRRQIPEEGTKACTRGIPTRSASMRLLWDAGSSAGDACSINFRTIAHQLKTLWDTQHEIAEEMPGLSYEIICRWPHRTLSIRRAYELGCFLMCKGDLLVPDHQIPQQRAEFSRRFHSVQTETRLVPIESGPPRSCRTTLHSAPSLIASGLIYSACI